MTAATNLAHPNNGNQKEAILTTHYKTYYIKFRSINKFCDIHICYLNENA